MKGGKSFRWGKVWVGGWEYCNVYYRRRCKIEFLVWVEYVLESLLEVVVF